MIDLDPMPAYVTFSSEHTCLQQWYNYAYRDYYIKYKVNNAPAETAPRHTYEKASDFNSLIVTLNREYKI